MLDIKWIRDNPQSFLAALEKRAWTPEAAFSEVNKLLELDARRREIVRRTQEIQSAANTANTQIGILFSSGNATEANAKRSEAAELKAARTENELKEREAEAELNNALAVIPNLPLEEVPVGDETKNKVDHTWGELPNKRQGWGNEFRPKEHYELGEALGQMDFETAAKLSGARFVVLKQGLARMERALGQFMLDLHTTEHGYEEVQPPLLVRDEVMFGTAQLPKFREDQFEVNRMDEHDYRSYAEAMIDFAETGPEDDFGLGELARNYSERVKSAFRAYKREDEPRAKEYALEAFAKAILTEIDPQRARLWLIPTAEVPLTNLVRESILSEEDLPLRFTALTPCFRSEAGAAGKDTRGMLRQHQFDKVELVSITTPEQSRDEHERMLTCAEEVLRRLDLHYRVMTLSTGDMGFAAQKTYDIEVWLPGQDTYREISSCSVCGDFQARRMKARYRPADPGSKSGAGGKGTRLVHTLNGSGIAVGRALIAVMENYQNPDGSITVPDALRSYMGGLERIEA